MIKVLIKIWSNKNINL